MKNKRLFTIHSVAGLLAGLFVLALSLSGTLLVFREQLDSLQRPNEFPTNDFQKILTVDESYKNIQQRYPYSVISSCAVSYSKEEPVIFSIYDSSFRNGTEAMQLFVHPQTGAVLKTRGAGGDVSNNFMSWLSGFHSSFHAGKTGEWLLGFFAIIFVISIVTGIILYRKSLIATLLLRKHAWKKGNFHQLIGTGALLFNLMIGITGFWMQRYVFKKEFYQSNSWVNTIKPSPQLYYNFDSAYHSLQKKYPAFTGYMIYFAQSKKGKTAIYGSNAGNAYIHSKKFADVVFLDSMGAVAKTRFINGIPADDRYDIINSQLHMGKYGGMGIKIIYGLLGISSALLSITGFILWLKRRRRKVVNSEW
jgi:uncharacterized iron-regulated membrane protein